jgi:miniconductance mechanosensitive channel
MVEIIKNWTMALGLSENTAGIVGWIGAALGVIILAFVVAFITRKFLLAGVRYFVGRTGTQWDDFLLKRKFFTRLSHLAPAIVIYFTAHMFAPFDEVLQRFSNIYMILAGLLAVMAFLSAVVDIYNSYDISRHKPIKGYVQVVKIILSGAVGVIVFAAVLGKSPWYFMGGLGAMTAVLILVFKDSILGLVAGIQLSANDMVGIGDWIEMPKYGADGDVIDVTLNTVKVQNWDKTITTIPAYALISDSFKNWQGMSESGGRRIKRSISIDMDSIRFCTPEMLDRFETFGVISDYIKTKRAEIEEFNSRLDADTSVVVNRRNLTNVGTFRAYIESYLRTHPKVHQSMTFLVRQLPPDEHGLPIEIYVFSNDQNWVSYEGIQSDIFDHLLAVVPMFDLAVFQMPSGSDFRLFAAQTRQTQRPE